MVVDEQDWYEIALVIYETYTWLCRIREGKEFKELILLNGQFDISSNIEDLLLSSSESLESVLKNLDIEDFQNCFKFRNILTLKDIQKIDGSDIFVVCGMLSFDFSLIPTKVDIILKDKSTKIKNIGISVSCY